MQSLTNIGYPRGLQYVCRKLNGYSRNNFKLNSLNSSTASAGNIITVDLPNNSMVDLSTLNMFFKGKTDSTAGKCVFSRGIESILERVETECNAQILSTGCQFLNQLYQVLNDTTVGTDANNRRSILQNAADSGVPNAYTVDKQFCINNWLGFIGSVSPNVIDTSLLGNVRLRISLATPNVLVQSSDCAGASYSLSDIFFSVDCIDIQDGIFHQLHDKFLSSGQTYEMPFNNYYSFSSTCSGFNQSTKFSLSSQSLNRVWGIFTSGTPYNIASIAGVTSGAYLDPISKCSSYFTRYSGGKGGVAVDYGGTTVTYKMSDYQFQINGQFFPNWRPSPDQGFGMLTSSYGIAYDTSSGCHPNLFGLDHWLESFFVAEARFDHGGDGVSLISGQDTRGNVSMGSFNSSGEDWTVSGSGGSSPKNLQCIVFAQTTSSLIVGAGRQLELVL
jgi:hypothetical protein